VKRLLIILAAAGAVMTIPAPAFADVIDGTWCFKEQSLSIDGPKIITPGRNAVTGNYTRHGFDYQAPVNERDAGSIVRMVLLNDDMMNLWVGSPTPEPGAVQLWRRCAPVA
jgi:hypothetical protein